MTPLESRLLADLATARGLSVAQVRAAYVAEAVLEHDEIEGAAA